VKANSAFKVRIGPRDASSEAHTKVSLETLVEERVRQRLKVYRGGGGIIRAAAGAVGAQTPGGWRGKG